MNATQQPDEWFADDEFWTTLFPYMFPEARFAAAEASADDLLALSRPAGRDVLDLCCGPGRFSVALARHGYRVTGVDRSPFLLARAREHAASEQLEVEWVHEDMRRFVRPNGFDLVLNLFTSFGYFDDKEDDLLVLQRIFESLRPGGALVLETLSKERLAKVFQPVTCEEQPDGTLLIQRHEVFDDWTRIRNEWLLVQGETVRRFRFHHTVYSGQELRDRLESVGFAEVSLYGSLSGEAYGPQSTRLIIVARKAS